MLDLSLNDLIVMSIVGTMWALIVITGIGLSDFIHDGKLSQIIAKLKTHKSKKAAANLDEATTFDE